MKRNHITKQEAMLPKTNRVPYIVLELFLKGQSTHHLKICEVFRIFWKRLRNFH